MDNQSQKDFSCNSEVFNMTKNVDRADILEYIKAHNPISIWDLAKEFKINRNILYNILRDFAYSGLIKTRIRTSKNKKRARYIYYNSKKLRYADNGF